MIAEQSVHWSGELLWPADLPDAAIIDMSEVAVVGSWLCSWFRERGQRCVVGATREIRQQLQEASLPILWYASLSEVQRRHHGVTGSERAMLWE